MITGPSQQRLFDLFGSGRLQEVADQCGSPRALAAYVGMTPGAFRAARDYLRSRGIAFPSMRDLFQRQQPIQEAAIGGNAPRSLPQTLADAEPNEWPEDPTNPGIHPDIPRIRPPVDPPLPAVPRGFVVREVATGVDADGHTEKQWIGARQEGLHYEVIQPSIPVSHLLRGVSTLVDETGNVRAQWIKTGTTAQQHAESLLAALPALLEPYRGAADTITPPATSLDDLLCVIPMGDPHLGLYSWADETGQSFDLDTAEGGLISAVDHLVNLSPPAKHGLLINLGDFFHVDSNSNTTTKGTRQDVDTRWGKVYRVGIRTIRRLIDRMLQKHEHVTVINEIGNHDETSAQMLSICLSEFYERETRVTVDTSPEHHHWYRFGKCLIGTTHKPYAKGGADLMGVMAVDRAKDWGETVHRHIYCGHVHHDSSKELPGVTVETLRTLAAPCKWSRSEGYRSGQDMKCDTYHREWGRISRNVVGINQLLAGLKSA